VTVRPLLGDVPVPRVEAIHASERRDFVELEVPGLVGSLFHDLNTAPTRLTLAGSVFGDEARQEFLTKVRGTFRDGRPVTFVADIVTATEITYVVVEGLEVQQTGTRPDELAFVLTLRESPPPPPPPSPLGELDAGLLNQAASFVDSVSGALAAMDALGSIPDFGNPVPPLTSALDAFADVAQGAAKPIADLRTLFGLG
jgi:hypothetical protein